MTRVFSVRVLILLCWCYVLGISTIAAQQSSYRSADCPEEVSLFDMSAETAGETYECGVLTVPQNRQTFDGRTIRLPVLTLKASGATDQAPIVYLSGGPGGSAIAELDFWRTSPLRLFHDIILIEQRGTALTTPNLLCSEFQQYVNLPVKSCAERLRSAGVAESIDVMITSSRAPLPPLSVTEPIGDQDQRPKDP